MRNVRRDPAIQRGRRGLSLKAILVVTLVTAVGCTTRAKVAARHPNMPFPEIKDLSTIKIKLRRTICFGTCPSYRVEVDGSGLVIFEGYEFVAIPGRHTVRIPEASVRALIEAFRQADYFSAEDAYEVTAMDVPTYVTSLAMNGQEKQVVDYLGTEAGMPDGIRAVEQKIDEIAGTARWIKAKDHDALTALDAEGWDFRSPGADNMAIYSSAIENKNLALLRRYLDTGAPVRCATFIWPLTALHCYEAGRYRPGKAHDQPKDDLWTRIAEEAFHPDARDESMLGRSRRSRRSTDA